jgi:hypothetical protein
MLKDSRLGFKRWYLVASVFMAAILIITAPLVSADSRRDFRQKNGLQPYAPPDWFIKGYFIACEKNPKFVFGTIQDFVAVLGGTSTWLIEDMELERVRDAVADGKKIEYSLFLETAWADHTEYWVFVVLPYESAQAWYDAKRAYHGRKAEEYYGKTLTELERAQRRGFMINAELRYWIENGETRLKIPEDIIMSRYKFKPVFDLGSGCRPNPAARTE